MPLNLLNAVPPAVAAPAAAGLENTLFKLLFANFVWLLPVLELLDMPPSVTS